MCVIEQFKDWFYYDPTSPSGLRWKKDSMSGMYYKIPVKKAGEIAGRQLTRRGGQPWCWGLSFKNKTYKVHRVIWMIQKGNIPEGMMIDHLDRNPFNNNIENLSLKTNKGNQQNKKKNVNNKTGVTGVSISKTGSYVASYVDIDGKYIRKIFSTTKLGEEKAFEMACDYRKEAILRLNSLGENYTETHGE